MAVRQTSFEKPLSLDLIFGWICALTLTFKPFLLVKIDVDILEFQFSLNKSKWMENV